MTNIIKVPQFAWHGPKDLELNVPDGWQVEYYNMSGYDRPAMTDEQIRDSILNPIGAPRISEMARGKKEVVITFDDMTRVTRVARMVPFVLEELALAGIPDNRIRFLGATGTHCPMSRPDFVKKLGEDIVARFPVYNHNAYENCTYVGTTSCGTKVSINSEFMYCDFKIAIGSTSPHGFAVFSGGGKNVLPGVSSIETISYNHELPLSSECRTDYATNPRRLDMEETAKLAGLNFLIESYFNMWGEPVAIFAGAEEPAHDAAVKEAATHYLTKKAEDMDIVIANTYAKAMEASTGANKVASVRPGGDFILISNTPEGQVGHYLIGPWGTTTAGRQPLKLPVPEYLNSFIYFTAYPELSALQWFVPSPKVVMLTKWDEVIARLQGNHGDKAKVAVYPNADIQYFGYPAN
jgi:nickel-dependent lactate racemase